MPERLDRIWERAELPEAIVLAEETRSWAQGVLEQLVAQGLLVQVDLAKSVTCDSCGQDHVEEVLFIDQPASAGLRAYIPCPGLGRVRVPLERLRRWRVDFGRLAELTAEALAVAGSVERMVSERVWRLGKRHLAGRSWELFLARGLDWPDSAEIVQRVPQLRTASGVVLVVGRQPRPLIWLEPAPILVDLKSLLEWDSASLRLDLHHLESALPHAVSSRHRVVLSFPTPVGVDWEDVRLTVADLHLTVQVRDRNRRYSFAEAGFEDRRRKGVPNESWELLRLLARLGGCLPPAGSTGRAAAPSLKQKVGKLNERLGALLQLAGPAIRHVSKEHGYRSRCRMQAEGCPVIPIPPGTRWDQISLVEEKPGVLRVERETEEVVAVRGVAAAETGRSAGWEAATTDAVWSCRYRFTEIGLAGADGQLTGIGKLLTELLRAGGKLARSGDDPEMLTLCGWLSRFLPLSDSPFRFIKSPPWWIALFEASSDVAASTR